ncbi:hypothetical protein [Streptomyces anandii]|uniref:Uncharacterized protein n=1 Tax=Streptomyces anandii TaxID=285454 RepID=A0ABW6HGD3_9ACTN
MSPATATMEVADVFDLDIEFLEYDETLAPSAATAKTCLIGCQGGGKTTFCSQVPTACGMTQSNVAAPGMCAICNS